MKNIKMTKYIWGLGILITLISSCENKLDLYPRSEISDATFWKNQNDFKLAANALYNYLIGFTTDDNNSDIAYGLLPNKISNGTLIVPATEQTWTDSYTCVRQACKIIEMAKDYPKQDEISVYIGEAKFFRAYRYFKLLTMYGGIPLIKGLLDTNSPELAEPKSTREEVVDYILQDLDDAIVLLKGKKDSGTGRVSKGTALAFKARVALFEGTHRKYHGNGDANILLDQAISASNQVISDGEYSLHVDQDSGQSYRRLFIMAGDKSPESLLDIIIVNSINPNNGYSHHVIGSGGYNPTRKLANMYLCKDGLPIEKSPLFQGYNTYYSEYIDRDPRLLQTMIYPGIKICRPMEPDGIIEQWPGKGNNRNVLCGYMTYKFLEENVPALRAFAIEFDWHVIRYAEVLLINAEASFERNGTISNANLDKTINKLRERVGMAKLTNEIVAANGMDMKTEIRRERTIELAFEGFRRDDLNRWKTAEIELPKSIESVKIIGTQWENYPVFSDIIKNGLYDPASGVILIEKAQFRRFDSSKDYLWPIPDQERILNPQLIQNPGWNF